MATTEHTPGTLAVLLVDGDFELHKPGCRNIKQSMARAGNYFTIKIGAGYVPATEYDIIADLWSDQIAECTGKGGHYPTEYEAIYASFQHATKFHSCCAKYIGKLPAYKAPVPNGTPGPADLAGVGGKSRQRQTAAQKRQAKNMADAKAKPKPKPKAKPKPTVKPVPAATQNGAARLTRGQKTELATAVVRAAAEVLGDSVVMAGLGKDEAAKVVSHWLHHLPADRAAWPQSLPRPDRSDWR
jgi:hypothetical protein